MARTLLFAVLYQSPREAICSCDEHERIIDLLEAGDLTQATSEMRRISAMSGHASANVSSVIRRSIRARTTNSRRERLT